MLAENLFQRKNQRRIFSPDYFVDHTGHTVQKVITFDRFLYLQCPYSRNLHDMESIDPQ
jgi:hypothetical protein